jgi:hypothetical protein
LENIKPTTTFELCENFAKFQRSDLRFEAFLSKEIGDFI